MISASEPASVSKPTPICSGNATLMTCNFGAARPSTASAMFITSTDAMTGAANCIPELKSVRAIGTTAPNPAAMFSGVPSGITRKLSATARIIMRCPPAISKITSAIICMNCARIAPCVLLIGSKIAAPDKPIDTVICSPAVSAAAMTIAADNPITMPIALSPRNVAGVIRSASPFTPTIAAGVNNTANTMMSADRKRIGTDFADQTGATNSSPPMRSAVSTNPAVTPGAKKSGRPAAV